MQKHQHKPGLRPLATAFLAVAALAAGNQALASTAANTIIRNSVTVNYADAAGTNQAALSAQVDVTVNLVRSSPVLSAPVDKTTDSATDAEYAYTLTTTANGIATYNLTVSLSQSAGISGSTAVAAPSSVTLGATSVAASVTILPSGPTEIFVPRDNTSDSSINGLVANDLVVIGGQLFEIISVGSDTAGPGTTSIIVNGNGTALLATAGMLVAEQKGFTMTVDPGVVGVPGDKTITVNTAATDSVNVAYTAADQTITTVRGANLTVQKLVRNATTSAAGTGAAVLFGGNNYYASGVTGNPTDELEYLIVVSNAVGAADATNVRISDELPPFTSYVANSMRVENGGVLSASLGDSGADGDAAEFGGNFVYFYLGSGGTDGGASNPLTNDGTGGILTGATPNNVSRALFRVKIN